MYSSISAPTESSEDTFFKLSGRRWRSRILCYQASGPASCHLGTRDFVAFAYWEGRVNHRTRSSKADVRVHRMTLIPCVRPAISA